MTSSKTVGIEEDGNVRKWKAFMSSYVLSAFAASVAETVTYPLDVTKTRLQIQGERSLADNVSKTMKYRGMLGTAAGIVREEGLFKLWQGITPAIYRQLVYSGSRMAIYEYLREHVLGSKDKPGYSFRDCVIASVVAGSVGQFIASPTDLVKVQMQMEGRRQFEGKPRRIKNTHQAFVKIFREGGVRGLWKGCVPNVQRAALINLGDITTYDTAKYLIMKYTGIGDSMFTHFLSSALSGLCATILCTPADVIKTRIMNQPTENGRGTMYTSSYDCLKKTVHNEGFFALYKGFVPIWARLAPWYLIFWVTYEQIRKQSGKGTF